MRSYSLPGILYQCLGHGTIPWAKRTFFYLPACLPAYAGHVNIRMYEGYCMEKGGEKMYGVWFPVLREGIPDVTPSNLTLTLTPTPTPTPGRPVWKLSG